MGNQEPLYFDLNIGQILQAWLPRHAVREIIANALDEQSLSRTGDVVIAKTDGGWSVRDFGRGIRPEHLKQDENAEKLNNSSAVMGRFGFGLKDALATLHRRRIEVEILSPHGDITITNRAKPGFADELSLHAVIRSARDPHRVGTEVVLRGLAEAEMKAAKGFFLRFSGEQELGDTPYGQILRRQKSRPGRVYVKGLLIADEPAFAFSYNVTSLTAAMEKALNRERSNVGRTAYAGRVRKMLLACSAPPVAEILAGEIGQLDKGTAHDEVKWTDVALHACKILNQTKKVVFVSSEELEDACDMVDQARADGHELVPLPRNIREKIHGLRDPTGVPVRGLDVFARDWAESFQCDFVEEENLTTAERALFSRRSEIADLAGGWPPAVREVLITETMRPDAKGKSDAVGLWEKDKGQIIIKRDRLQAVEEFCGTFLHELTHARSGESDVTREFESALTDLVGHLAANSLATGTALKVDNCNAMTRGRSPTKAKRQRIAVRKPPKRRR